jgi:dihydroflavonol-4-reductase
MEMVWRVLWIISLLTRKSPLITRETAANSNVKRKFDGSKIKNYFDFEYLPVSESIKQTSAILKQEIK